jgi:hypothetical protein
MERKECPVRDEHANVQDVLNSVDYNIEFGNKFTLFHALCDLSSLSPDYYAIHFEFRHNLVLSLQSIFLCDNQEASCDKASQQHMFYEKRLDLFSNPLHALLTMLLEEVYYCHEFFEEDDKKQDERDMLFLEEMHSAIVQCRRR